MDWKKFRDLAEYRGEKETYFEMFFMHYLYYSIVECHGRKVSIREVSRFFHNLYFNLAKKEEMDLIYYEYKSNAVCSSNSFKDNDAEIIRMAEKLRENSLYEKMFHLIDGYIVIDDGFSYSHNGAKKWGSNWSTGDLNIAFYYSRKELYDWREPKWIAIKKFIRELGAGYNQSLIEHLCKWHLRNPILCQKPLITPETEGIGITSKNLELGEYIAANFIYRCFKDWHISNEGDLAGLVRKPKILIKGVEYYPIAIKKKTDDYRIKMIKKYPELARRFAFLIQTAKNGQIVFESAYEPVEYGKLRDRDPDADEAFRLGRKRYILEVAGKYHQGYTVKKNNDGEVLFKDSVSYSMTNLEKLSPEKRKSKLPEKGYLEEELSRMEKERAEKIKEKEEASKYKKAWANFNKEKTVRKMICETDIRQPFAERNWYVESQKIEYFEKMLMHYLYYNITEGLSRKISIIEINSFFQRLYDYFSKPEIINTKEASFENYAYCPEGPDGLKETKEKIAKMQKNPKYKGMFNLSGDMLIVEDAYSYSPKYERISNHSSLLNWLQTLLYLTKKDLASESMVGEEKDEKTEKKRKFINNFKFIGWDQTIIEHICKKSLSTYNTPRISAASEGVEITEENLEYGKMLAARIIPNYHLEDVKEQYLAMAQNFAFLIQTCKSGDTIFDGTFDEGASDYKPIKKEADMIFRRDYILEKTCWIVSDIGITYNLPIQTTLVVKKDFKGNIFITDSNIQRKGRGWINISEISQRDYNKYFAGKDYLDYLIQLEKGRSLKLTKRTQD